MKSKSHPPLRLFVPISLDEAVSISHLIFAFRDSLGSDESIAQVAWSGKLPALKLIPGGGESWRSKLKAKLRPTLLFILVATSIFVVARSVSSALRPDVARQAHSEVAAIVQRAASQQSAGRSQAWIEGGWQELRQRQDDPGANSETEGAKLRRLDRQIDSLEPGPDQQHLRGLLALKSAMQNGDPSAAALREAEQEILEVLEKEPKRAGAWNDLAAVYLTWAEQHDRPRLLLDAFAATHAALELQTDFAEAHLNQAQALEGLGLFQPAAAALDFDWPDWVDRQEVEQRRKRLEATDPVALRERYLEELEKAAEAGHPAGFAQSAEKFPQTARRWVEEVLLPRWGTAHAKGDQDKAGSMLALARGLGEQLAEPSDPAILSDTMLRDTIATIDHAAARGDVEVLENLTRGHEAFGRGMGAFPGNVGDALPNFREAEQVFKAAGSPFAGWAIFYEAACLHVDRNLPSAMAYFDGLRTDGERFPSLGIRLGWGRGLIFNHLDQSRAALDEYRAARELAIAQGDSESAAAIVYQEAEAEAILALHEDVWRSQAIALRMGNEPLRARYRVNILSTAASRARTNTSNLVFALKQKVEAGLVDIRRLFEAEAVQVAERSGTAYILAESRNRLAATLEVQGRLPEAAEQGRLALESIASIPDPVFRQRTLAEMRLFAADSELSAISDEELEEAAKTFREQLLHFRVVEVDLVLAERSKRRGRLDEREKWLIEAQNVIEEVAASLDIGDRHGYLAALKRIFRARIAIALESSDDGEVAFRLFLREQRLRRRAISTQKGPGGGLELASEHTKAARQLPSDSVFVALLELPDDRLAALVDSPTGIVARRLPIARSDLTADVTELRQLIGTIRKEASWDAIAAADFKLKDLSRQLIAPIEDLFPATGRLGLSLDESFAGIPFEALYSYSPRQRLVERFEISRLATPAPLVRAPRPLAIPEVGFLVVAADKPAATWLLRDLGGVAEEAQTILSSLGPSRVQLLMGRESTPRRILAKLAESRWFHFAGHALEDPTDPTRSLLILAEEGGESTALSLQDLVRVSRGHLEMAIFAGCETASDGTGGLAQAIERIGVPITIGSLWSVGDQATAEFFTEFYQRLATGMPPAQAFRETQLAALHSRDSQLASVAVWAAFAVFGG